jgi:hypothetical protein
MAEVVSCAIEATGTISTSKTANAEKQSRILLFIDLRLYVVLWNETGLSDDAGALKAEIVCPEFWIFALEFSRLTASHQPLKWRAHLISLFVTNF